MEPFAERSGFSRNTVAFSYFVIYNVLVKELSQSEINMKEVLILANEIMVSVICNAYNHERYIRDALDGFLMQKTNFAFEVLIHDDASTDKTADIIREYEAKYPDIIKPIYQTENQYSKDPSIVISLQYSRVRGKYISLCEGDDYWTDPLKLQKQVDAMENHPEIDICAHGAYQVDAETKMITRLIRPAKKRTIFSVRKVIIGGGAFVATNSLLYRSELVKNLPAFVRYFGFDYAWQIHGTLRSGMLYLPDIMSSYRYLSANSWTSSMCNNHEKIRKHYKVISIMLSLLDAETNYCYTKTIHKKIVLDYVGVHRDCGTLSELLKPNYHEFFQCIPIITKIEIYIRLFLPWLVEPARKLYGRILKLREK